MCMKITTANFLIYIVSETINTFQCREIKKTDQILTLNKQLYTTTNNIFTMLKLDRRFGEFFRIKPLIVMHRDLKQITEATFKKYKDIENASKPDNDIGNQLLNMTGVLDIIFDEAINTSSKQLLFRRNLSQIRKGTRNRNGEKQTGRMIPTYKSNQGIGNMKTNASRHIDDAINHLRISLQNLSSIMDQDSQIVTREKLSHDLRDNKLNRTITTNTYSFEQKIVNDLTADIISDEFEKNHKTIKKKDNQQLAIRLLRYTPPARGAAAEQSIFDDENKSGAEESKVDEDDEHYQNINRERKIFGKYFTKINETEIYGKSSGMGRLLPKIYKMIFPNNNKNVTTKKVHEKMPLHNENENDNVSSKTTTNKPTTYEITDKPNSKIEEWVKENYFTYEYEEEDKNILNYTIDTLLFRALNDDTRNEHKPMSNKVNADDVFQVNLSEKALQPISDDQHNIDNISTFNDYEEISNEKHILDYVYVD